MDDGPVKMFKILTMRLFVVLKSSVAHFLDGLWLSPYLKPTVRQESPTFIPAFFEIRRATVDETYSVLFMKISYYQAIYLHLFYSFFW